MNKSIIISIFFIQGVAMASAQSSNLIRSSSLKTVCENGIFASISNVSGKNQLKVVSAPTQRDPSIYLATLAVEPGKDYTYFLKATKSDSARIFLYVTTSTGNLVWPGGELENGIARSTFTIPNDVTEITLAMAFLHPERKRSVILQDIALFQGNVSEWLSQEDPIDFSFVGTGFKPYTGWLLALSAIILGVVVFIDQRLTKRWSSEVIANKIEKI